MKIVQQFESNSIQLELGSIQAAEKFFDDVKSQGAFFLELFHELEQYQKQTINVTAPPEFDFEFEAEVLQVIPQTRVWGTAFQLCWRPGKSEELYNKLRG